MTVLNLNHLQQRTATIASLGNNTTLNRHYIGTHWYLSTICFKSIHFSGGAHQVCPLPPVRTFEFLPLGSIDPKAKLDAGSRDPS